MTRDDQPDLPAAAAWRPTGQDPGLTASDPADRTEPVDTAPSHDADLVDTAEQPVLRLGPEPPSGEPDLLPGLSRDDAPGATRAPAHPGRRWRRGRHVWIVAAVTAAVVAAGATTYAIGRQAPAAAQAPGPAAASPTAVGGEPPQSTAAADAAPLPPGKDTLVLGDSLALIVYPWLADLLPDRYVSYTAEVGSGVGWALDAVRDLKAQGEQIPRVVLVSAGTNDWYTDQFREDSAELLELLGPRRCVAWATVSRPSEVNGLQVDDADKLNDALRDLTARYPNLRLIDWAGLTAEHPDWLAGDGVHPSEEGAKARAEQFERAATACSPLDPDAPRARQQVLPSSAFFMGGSSAGSASTQQYAPSTSRSEPTRPSDEPTSTPDRTRRPKPSVEPTATRTPRTSTPTATEPPATGGGDSGDSADDPAGGGSGGSGGGGADPNPPAGQ